MFPVLQILGSLLGIGQGWLEHRNQMQQAKTDSALRIEEARTTATIARLQKADDAAAEWDNIVAKEMEGSWKDEFLTILLSLPAIIAFIPGGAKYVLAGF